MHTKWIIIEPVGGLCNRLRAIASALVLGGHLNRRVYLNWQAEHSCNCTFTDLFRKNEFLDFTGGWRGKVRTMFLNRERSRLLIDQEKLHELEYQIPTTQFDKYRILYFPSCFSDFIPRDYPAERYVDRVSMYLNKLEPIDLVLQRLFKLPPATVGVHIRRTDNTPAVERSRDDDFIRAMKAHLSGRPETHFYCATDDLEVEKHLVEIFGDRIISFPKTSYDRNTREAIQEALVDLLMLSSTESILGSWWSSFSEYASLFNRIPLDIAGHGVWEGPVKTIINRAQEAN